MPLSSASERAIARWAELVPLDVARLQVAYERRALAVRMRSLGLTLAEVGRRMGVHATRASELIAHQGRLRKRESPVEKWMNSPEPPPRDKRLARKILSGEMKLELEFKEYGGMSVIVNKYTPGIPSHGSSGELMIVLTQDEAGLHAAYMGIVPHGTHRDEGQSDRAAAWVAGCGEKLSFRKAQTWFSGLQEDRYRA